MFIFEPKLKDQKIDILFDIQYIERCLQSVGAQHRITKHLLYNITVLLNMTYNSFKYLSNNLFLLQFISNNNKTERHISCYIIILFRAYLRFCSRNAIFYKNTVNSSEAQHK